MDRAKKFMSLAREAVDCKDYRRASYNVDMACELVAGAAGGSSASNKSPTAWTTVKAEALIGAGPGQWHEANLLLNDILYNDAKCTEAIYLRGWLLYQKCDLVKAGAYLTEALRVDPDHKKSRVLLKVGWSFLWVHDDLTMSSSISHRPRCPRSILSSCHGNRRLPWWEKKSKALDQKKEQGNVLFKAGSYTEALSAYSEALEVEPALGQLSSKLYSNRATVLSKLGRHEEAVRDCDRALELDEEFFKVYLRRADCYMKLEKFEEAVRDYEKALSLDRGNRGAS